MATSSANARALALPPSGRVLLWDQSGEERDEHALRQLLIRRVVGEGSWADVMWLRERYGREAIREWLVRTRGRHLDRRTLRLWEVLLELDAREVEGWLSDDTRRIWDGRNAF